MEAWLYIVGLLVQGAALYGALRAEIRALAEGVREAKHEAVRAHERIDVHIRDHSMKGAKA